jgi:hypothetical protein
MGTKYFCSPEHPNGQRDHVAFYWMPVRDVLSRSKAPGAQGWPFTRSHGKVRNDGNYTSNSPFILTTWRLISCRDNLYCKQWQQRELLCRKKRGTSDSNLGGRFKIKAAFKKGKFNNR